MMNGLCYSFPNDSMLCGTYPLWCLSSTVLILQGAYPLKCLSSVVLILCGMYLLQCYTVGEDGQPQRVLKTDSCWLTLNQQGKKGMCPGEVTVVPGVFNPVSLCLRGNELLGRKVELSEWMFATIKS